MASTMALSIAICWRVFYINAMGLLTLGLIGSSILCGFAINRAQTLVNAWV